ncbi:hypothetical protein FJZ53_04670 [Candidatus Woesearchaeota archaeon]|nr:hypothetical protein [Candidatus Woesearchaeota archaeon]
MNSIKNGVADITTKRLAPLPEKEVPTEEVPPTEKPAEVTPPTQAKAASKTWQWILIIAIIAVIAAGYWFTQKKK